MKMNIIDKFYHGLFQINEHCLQPVPRHEDRNGEIPTVESINALYIRCVRQLDKDVKAIRSGREVYGQITLPAEDSKLHHKKKKDDDRIDGNTPCFQTKSVVSALPFSCFWRFLFLDFPLINLNNRLMLFPLSRSQTFHDQLPFLKMLLPGNGKSEPSPKLLK
jgi:hypothetical protein